MWSPRNVFQKVPMSCVGQTPNHSNHVVPTGEKPFSGRAREKPQVTAIKAGCVNRDNVQHHIRTEEPKFLNKCKVPHEQIKVISQNVEYWHFIGIY